MISWFLLLSLPFAAPPQITTPPAGPYHVEGNRILDANGSEFLIRGTALPPVTLDPFPDFGPFSRTTLITLRQRMNMNAVRLRIRDDPSPAYHAFVKELVQKANQLELLVIIECKSPTFAADFKSNPNVFFAVPTMDAAAAIRSAGATQPIIVPHGAGANIICQFPAFSTLDLPESIPLLADEPDPPCASFPSDPAAASQRIEDVLTQFDQRHISWTISSMEPGKLIDNYRGYDWSKLDDGWTCGEKFRGAGIGMALLSHLWSADAHGVFTVNQPAGGLVIARGAHASAYGRILAEREAGGNSLKLSNISIQVTDSKGISRLAPLLWTGAGWSSANLIIPKESAPGPAEVTVVRSDGSKTASKIIIADGAPGLWTLTGDGRGLVDARVFQHSARLEGTGFRFAKSVRGFVDGLLVPTVSFGAIPASSRDQVTIQLPDTLVGRGEVDLFMIADGKLSNVVRINVGSATPKIRLGRYLFYDKRMSVNGASSCASCHRQELAFTDGRAQAIGATQQLHPRSAMSLVNLSSSTTFNWNDPTVRSLEQQALKPMRSTNPVELGVNEASFVRLIRSDETYKPLFRQAFSSETDPYTISNVARAIAAFERTLTSSSSPYDRFHRDSDPAAISESAKRGEILFFLDGGPSCFRCHSGSNFSDSAYHNNGLGASGKFKTPTLRNIALTAPYMHDGSIPTLEQVVDHYASGGKAGHDPIMRGFYLTPQNRADLVEFLKCLTDENLLHDQRYSDPWP